MSEVLGRMIYVDSNQFQQSTETETLQAYLSGLGIQDRTGFQLQVESVFQKGSQNRSFFFFNMSFRNFTQYEKGRQYRIPLFGVKGRVPGITRDSNYTEILTAPEKKLNGSGFSQMVFGSSYMSAKEGIENSRKAALSVLERPAENVPVRVPRTDRDLITAVFMEIWKAQKQDPRTRIIIRLSDAENSSLEFLKNLYLLMPNGLKMQMGFESNVTMTDLKLVDEFGGLPFYIFTMGEKERLDKKALNYPIAEIDKTTIMSDMDDSRYRLVRSLCGKLDEVYAAVFDYMDETYKKEQGLRYSSFQYFEELLQRRPDMDGLLRANDRLEALQLQLIDQKEKVNAQKRKIQELEAIKRQLADTVELLNVRLAEKEKQLDEKEEQVEEKEQQIRELQAQYARPIAADDEFVDDLDDCRFRWPDQDDSDDTDDIVDAAEEKSHRKPWHLKLFGNRDKRQNDEGEADEDY